jgi:outer membrane receptor protein involved in Fe transport
VVGSTARRNPVLYEVNGETQFSVRVPAPFNQIYSNVVYRGNGDLDPESIESYEIGLFSEVLDSSLTTDLKLFSYKITDQITEGREPIDPVQEPTVLNETSTTSANGGVTKVKGVEASFNYSPQRKSYRLYGGISLIRSDSFDIDIEHSMPEYTAFTGGHYDLSSKQQISGVLYWVDEMSWLDSDDNLDSYHKLDLRYQYTIIPKMQMKVELIGYNLLQDIEDYLLSKTQGRTYLIRLSSRF